MRTTDKIPIQSKPKMEFNDWVSKKTISARIEQIFNKFETNNEIVCEIWELKKELDK